MTVVIPFAPQLADQFTTDRVEARRGFPHLMNMVQAIAVLHQFQRQVDSSGRLLATLEDYRVARQLLSSPLGRLLGRQLSEAATRYLERLSEWARNMDCFTSTEASKRDNASRRSVQLWLSELSDHGRVEIVEPHKGNKPAKWRLAESDDTPFGWSLPDLSGDEGPLGEAKPPRPWQDSSARHKLRPGKDLSGNCPFAHGPRTFRQRLLCVVRCWTEAATLHTEAIALFWFTSCAQCEAQLHCLRDYESSK